MPLPPIVYITDSSSQQWQIACTNAAVLRSVPISGGQPVVPHVYVNSVTDGLSYEISIVGNPPPVGRSWGDFLVTSVPQGQYPTQILINAPNGTVYALQVATVGPPIIGSTTQGILQTALPVSGYNCNTPISALAGNVLARLEENYASGIDAGPVFWNTQFEINAGIVEALNETILLVGRPTQTVNVQFNLVPNTPWQQIPKGVLLLTDIWGGQSRLRKVSLWDMDYSQSSWGSDWENDVSDSGPQRWFPLGFGAFGIHPAPSTPQIVLLDGIAYPTISTYPYDGSQIMPFENHWFEMFEMYCAVYSRLKEGSQEFQESMPMLQNFYKLAERMTQIQDRRDPIVFSQSFGGTVGVNALKKR